MSVEKIKAPSTKRLERGKKYLRNKLCNLREGKVEFSLQSLSFVINTAQALSAPPPLHSPPPPPPRTHTHTLPSPLPGEIGLSSNDLDAVETESASQRMFRLP